MDADLFQLGVLILLALTLAALVGLLATVSAIRTTLERSTASGEHPLLTASGETGDTAVAAGGDATGAQGTTPAGVQPQAAQVEPTSAVLSSQGSGGRADTIRTVLEQHGLEQHSLADTERGAAAPTTTSATTPGPGDPVEVDSAFAAHADDPQEEPFQRDGRWWFRRGGELLLYNEATGQWEQAPSDSPVGAASVPAAAAEGAGTAGASAQGTTATAVSESPEPEATFWKCPTCGAVNGSTATSCRMCFAGRP